MSRRPPSTYLSAVELEQIRAIEFNRPVSSGPGPDQRSASRHQNFGEMEGYLVSKEPEAPK